MEMQNRQLQGAARSSEETPGQMQARLRFLVSSTPAVIYTARPSGDYGATFISENVTSQLGYEPREFLEDSGFWIKHVHPDDAARVLAELPVLLERGHHIHEYRFLHKDGAYRWLLDEMNLVRAPDGNPFEVIGYMIDITERKRAEEALRESESRYRTLVEMQVEAVCRWLPDTRLTFVNEGYCRVFGRTREELLGTKWISLVPESAREEVERIYRNLAENPAPHSYEHEVSGAGGQIRRFHWIDCPILNEQGRVVEFQSVGRDVTERSRAETALRESEEKYRRLFATVPDAIVIFDAETHRFLDVNKSTLRLYGYTLEEFLNLTQIDVSAEPEESKKAIEETLAGKRNSVPLRYHRKKDGTVFPVEISAGVFPLGGRKVLCAVIRDITQRKRGEDALAAQRVLLMRSDRLRFLGEMAAGICHELNQPLSGVRGLAEALLAGLDKGWNVDSETAREKLRFILEQADRMTHIINRIRQSAREGSSRAAELVDVNKVARSAMDLLGTQFRARGLRLVLELSEGMPKILANRFSLEEVVLNLLTNARDAMEERLQADPVSAVPEVLLRTFSRCEGAHRLVHIQVVDGGVGIPAAILPRVFEPLFSTKPADKGTGLGLSICKAIVDDIGGTIELESKPGHGTTATVSLPVRTDRLGLPG